KDPSGLPEAKKAAVNGLKQVLAPGRPRLSDLANEYADFGENNPSYRRQTIAGLKTALEQLPEGHKKDLLPAYRRLAVLHCKDLLTDADKLIDNNDRGNADKQLKAAAEYALDDAATQ